MPLVLIKSDAKAREKPCLRCGYSLRKITDSRHCPECGLSVWVSLNQNDSLDWSRPEWLRVISIGAVVMAGAQALAMAGGAIVIGAGLWRNSWVISWMLGAYLMALGGGMVVLAVPEKRYPDQLKGFRWFVGVCGVVMVLLGVAICAMSALSRPMLPVFLIEMLLLVGAVATLLYIRKLAHRMGSHKLAKVLGWLLLIPLLKFVQVFPFWGIYLGWHVIGVGTVLPWLYVPVSLGILLYLAIGFRRCAKEAEVNWAKAG
jgi:hypothetical protein